MDTRSTHLMYYGTIVVTIVGLFGGFCNIITFTSSRLRKNPCAFYFLISSIFDLLSISFGLMSAFALTSLGSILHNKNLAYCKIRAYLIFSFPVISIYMVLLASIDRFLGSSISSRLRRFSQIKVAYWASIITIIIGFLTCAHVLIGYRITPPCGPGSDAYALFDSIFSIFWISLAPQLFMLIFGFLTILNIRRTKNRMKAQIQSVTINPEQRHEQKTNTQLIIVSSCI